MSIQQITYAFKWPVEKVFVLTITGEELPTLPTVIWLRHVVGQSPIYIRGPIPVPDAPPQSLDDETLAKVRDALEKYGDFYDLALEKRLPPASIVAMIDELTALRARVGGEVAQ